MSTLSSKLTRIDSSINSIRETIESPNAVIEDVAEGVKTEINRLNTTINEKTANEEALANELMKYQGKGIVYNVTEESAMLAITDAPEGSICIIESEELEMIYIHEFINNTWEIIAIAEKQA